MRALLDALLADGRAALACDAPAPTKVLSPDEMREYHDDDDDGASPAPAEDSAREYAGTADDDDDDESESDADPAPTTSEEEVTQLVGRVSASPPPITITQPAES